MSKSVSARAIGASGWSEEYGVGAEFVRIAGEAVPGVAGVLHLKLFHPANDYYGLSPIEAAATAVDIHNAAARWTKALLDVVAGRSGASANAAVGAADRAIWLRTAEA